MKKGKYPVGTKFVRSIYNESFVIDKHNHDKYHVIWNNGKHNLYYMNSVDILEYPDWTIIIPHGYSTPLWRVLNGEDVE